ncbi:hypothetical protein niasHT_015653 [Heterodera trifolii]|uniref:Trichohyalin n=1 Tax=Heterodera trifolii TaxID=157864 RepID=A0ABD2L5K2_9BILA
MASNESPTEEDNANANAVVASSRLFDALKRGEGIAHSLAEAIENGDTEQLQHWYDLIAEVPFEELQQRLGNYELVELLRTVNLLMQWEHAQGEELKEVIDREVTESAEREESWKTEREELKSELIKAKSRSEMGEINEAFREEIEALTAENAQMKQMGRERDGEMAKMGERTEQLEERLRGAERENALLISNQAQLEDSIRELNRRLNTQSEAKQQGAEWEARKLRQRNEQAMVLSEQVRELAAQNDELREEIDRLSGALDEANGLLKENTARFAEFNEQFEEAEKQLERLRSDNDQLRKIMEEKEKALKERTLNVQMSSREFVEVVQEKDTLLEKQRVQLQQTKAELEQCRLSLETAIKPNEQREEELDRLRVELINATEAARKLFGVEALAGEEQMDDGDAARAEGAARELRLRMIQMDQQLEQQERSLAQKRQTEHETEQALEQKDLQIARLLTECQRYRKMAFGDAEGQMARIEKQLEYRNKQIEQLNRRCSELQIELEQYIGEEEQAEKQRKEKKGETEEGGQMAKRKRVTIREEEGKEEEAEESMDEEETEEEKEEEEEEEEYREEIMEEWEEEKEEKTEEKEKREEMEEKRETERTEAKEGRKRQTEKQTVVRRRKSREQLLREATDVQALHGEITRLIRDLKQTEEELNLLRKQYNERGKLLKEEREAKAKARRETDRLRELLLFNGGDEEAKDPLDKLEGSDQTMAEESDRAEEGKAEQRGQADPFTELRERERMESLELENAELRRFVENVAENGRDERERRMAEGTRRLVFLAVKEAKLERRLQISKRLRMAMSTEMRTMKDRLSRVLSGEESKSRQLFVENEAKLFELARLQNALLHSVPVHEYNRLLRQHKRLLRDRFMSSPSDMGYHSETEQPTEDDDFVDKIYTEQHLNIGRTVGDSVHWHNEWSQLREMNDVLRGQNDALNREREKLKAELDELNAFLDDIEAETELKSMLVNIERRFLQALREQFECAEEREALGSELRRSERNFSEARDRWLSERRRLVDTIDHLNSALQRLHRDQLLAIPGSVHVTTSQLEALATHLRSVYQKEREASGRETDLAERAEEMQRAESALMAKRAALETILDRDGELRAVHAVLQGYALNEVTLSAELQRTRKKLEKVEKEMNERTEELEELREMLTHFQHVNEVDLKQLEQQIEQRQKRGEEGMDKKEEKQSEGKEKQREEKEKQREEKEKQREEKEKQREEKEKQREEKETKGDKEEEEQAQKRGDSSRRTVLMVDNSSEWAEQLQQVREQAKLCVDTYKEQLESRDKTLDEYRQLVEQLRTELTEVRNGRREAEEQRKRDGAETEEEKSGERKRTDEWEAEEAEERWERRTRALERQLRRMAEEQAEMERERTKLRETIRAKEESERRHREGEGTRDVKVQVSISQPKAGRGRKANTSREETTAGEEDEREEEKQEDGEREGDEADKEDQADLEEQEEADSSASDGGRGGRGGSDSGTVEDIRQNEREGTQGSDSVGREARKSKASTRTISQRRSFGMEAVQDMETMVMRHRNETRRLRMRVMELERRNRELSEQYASLRERSRLAMRPRSTPSAAAAGGTDAAVDALRRENERLKRENSNLNKSLEKQREEAERTAVRLRRMETQSRANAEAWEERKRNERSAALLRKRIEEGAERERLLQERLERRERHIEQLSREQQGRLGEAERVQATMAQWRAKVALLEQREGTLSQERVVLGERCNELTRRLEAMAREHGNAKKRLAELTKAQQEKKAEEKLREEGKAIGGEGNQKIMARKTEDRRREAQTQTEEPNKEQEKKPMPNEAGGVGTERKSEGRIRSAPPSAGKAAPTAEWEGKWREAEMREMAQQWEEENAEKQRLTKKLRRAELLQRETEEQLETQRKAKERLETEHNALLRLEKRRTLREETESVGMALIRDKLAAKEREVSAQRHRIIELERKLWHMEMAMESEQ